MSFLASILAFFGRLLDLFLQRYWYKLGASETKKLFVESALKVIKAQNKASTEAPKKKSKLLDLLRSGKASLVFVLLLAACCNSPAVTCLTLQPWTEKDQDELAANLSTIPEDSPIIAMALDWSRMRAETKACLAATME